MYIEQFSVKPNHRILSETNRTWEEYRYNNGQNIYYTIKAIFISEKIKHYSKLEAILKHKLEKYQTCSTEIFNISYNKFIDITKTISLEEFDDNLFKIKRKLNKNAHKLISKDIIIDNNITSITIDLTNTGEVNNINVIYKHKYKE